MTKINKMKEIEKIKKNFIICYLEFLLLNFSKKYLLILKIRGKKSVPQNIFTILNFGIMILEKLNTSKNFIDKTKIFRELKSPLSENNDNYCLLLQNCPEYLKLVQELEDIIMIAKSDVLQNKFFYRFYKYYDLKNKELNNLVMKNKTGKKEITLINNINNILLEIKLYDRRTIPLYKFNFNNN